jgi:AbrB family looped-hinge helix DNA binding protein
MASSTLTTKGRITVPKAIRDRLGLVRGDILDVSVDADGRLVARPVRPQRSVFGVLSRLAPTRPVSDVEMRRAIRALAAYQVLHSSKGR